jgi:hypothetical protein
MQIRWLCQAACASFTLELPCFLLLRYHEGNFADFLPSKVTYFCADQEVGLVCWEHGHYLVMAPCDEAA